MREALKNAIAPGRLPLVAAVGAKWGTRAGSNVDFAQAEPERSERQTLVDAVEIKRSAIAYFVLKMSV
jgi:hypothetical protein